MVVLTVKKENGKQEIMYSEVQRLKKTRKREIAAEKAMKNFYK